MELLNRFFSPFAAVLVLSALYFSEPDPRERNLAISVLCIAITLNIWISRRSYRYIKWTHILRASLIWINWLWSLVLFYLLGGYWGPMWLLFLMAPATAAMNSTFKMTLASAGVSAASLLAIYWMKGAEGTYIWAHASLHAAFILFFTMFVHAMAQTAVRMRDASV